MWRNLSRRRRRPAILALHDVREPRWLRDFLRVLLEHADIVPLRSLVDRQAGSAETRPQLALTFDDGYKSIRTIVQPVCKELAVPFTTFVCGEVVCGGPVPWYERVGLLAGKLGASRAARCFGLGGGQITKTSNLVSALKQAPLAAVLSALDRAEAEHAIDARPLRARYMNLKDLAAVAGDDLVTVGSHTDRHPILTNLRADEQRSEIERGIVALRDTCAAPIEFFAYPNGKLRDYNDAVIALLRNAGIRAAVTTAQRPLHPSDDVMQLPRLGVSEGDSYAKLDLKWSLPWVSVGDLREEWWRRRSQPRWSAGSHE